MGVLILRPTSDATVEHHGLGGEYFYQFINEDTPGSDGDASFIFDRTESPDDDSPDIYSATSHFNCNTNVSFPIYPLSITMGCVAKIVGSCEGYIAYGLNNVWVASGVQITNSYLEYTSTRDAATFGLNSIINNPTDIDMCLATSVQATGKGVYGENRISQLYAEIYYKMVYNYAANVSTGINSATVSAAQVIEGEEAIFTATVTSGYVFDGWYNGNTKVSDATVYVVPYANQNLTLTAKARSTNKKRLEVTYMGKKIVSANLDSASMTYNNATSSVPNGGKTFTCKNKIMKTNFIINGTTMKCKDKLMRDNINIMMRGPMTNLFPTNASRTTGGWNGTIDSTMANAILGLHSSLRMDATTSNAEVTVNLVDTIPQVQNHKYYTRVYEYHTNSTYTANGVNFQMYWPIAEPAMCYQHNATLQTANQWNMVSFIDTRSNWASGNQSLRVDFDNHYVEGSVWYTGFMLIDLTDTFGAGNEPTKAWCDKNIPYFVGTI